MTYRCRILIFSRRLNKQEKGKAHKKTLTKSFTWYSPLPSKKKKKICFILYLN